MTISDRRWKKAQRVASRVFDEAAPSWQGEVASTWVQAVPEPLLFDRNPAHLADTMQSIWHVRGRESFDPLAEVLGDLAERMRREPLGTGGSKLSSTVYSME